MDAPFFRCTRYYSDLWEPVKDQWEVVHCRLPIFFLIFIIFHSCYCFFSYGLRKTSSFVSTLRFLYDPNSKTYNEAHFRTKRKRQTPFCRAPLYFHFHTCSDRKWPFYNISQKLLSAICATGCSDTNCSDYRNDAAALPRDICFLQTNKRFRRYRTLRVLCYITQCITTAWPRQTRLRTYTPICNQRTIPPSLSLPIIISVIARSLCKSFDWTV